MSLFTLDSDNTLASLSLNIDFGFLGLPKIQRPFVWENAKVRDLFDSMYRGYPVGTLLFGLTGNDPYTECSIDQTNQCDPQILITGDNLEPPRFLIVDGLQRLIGLYSVFRGVPVLRNNSERERIRIAFNPLKEEFMVPDASTPKDPAWLPDISVIWNSKEDLLSIESDYLARYRATCGENSLSPEDESHIKSALNKLHSLPRTYTFYGLDLVPDMTEEEVEQIYVRANSMSKRMD